MWVHDFETDGQASRLAKLFLTCREWRVSVTFHGASRNVVKRLEVSLDHLGKDFARGRPHHLLFDLAILEE
jgi:hypothetical protein